MWELIISNPCCSCRGHGVTLELWKPCLPETPVFRLWLVAASFQLHDISLKLGLLFSLEGSERARVTLWQQRAGSLLRQMVILCGLIYLSCVNLNYQYLGNNVIILYMKYEWLLWILKVFKANFLNNTDHCRSGCNYWFLPLKISCCFFDYSVSLSTKLSTKTLGNRQEPLLNVEYLILTANILYLHLQIAIHVSWQYYS